jgi:hypothetical protein
LTKRIDPFLSSFLKRDDDAIGATQAVAAWRACREQLRRDAGTVLPVLPGEET